MSGKQAQVNVRVTDYQMNALDDISERSGISKSKLLRRAIDDLIGVQKLASAAAQDTLDALEGRISSELTPIVIGVLREVVDKLSKRRE